jgi:hypothetical protein
MAKKKVKGSLVFYNKDLNQTCPMPKSYLEIKVVGDKMKGPLFTTTLNYKKK